MNSNERACLLHGCVQHEIEAMQLQRSVMTDRKMLAHTYSYTLKLESLRDELKLEMETQSKMKDLPIDPGMGKEVIWYSR